jgi:hypothetical protein
MLTAEEATALVKEFHWSQGADQPLSH